MECKHKYFQYRDGKLVCSECGKPASELKKPAIEDKIADRGETKKAAQKETSHVGGQKRR
jgi:uncharacterized Zn finger protein (UPF0148 family)